MITRDELLSLGTLRRPQLKELPDFVFVLRDGLFVPFRKADATDLLGEEVFVRRTDVRDEDDGLLTWQDLVGYMVRDEGEEDEWREIGVIAEVDESTINTVATLEDGRMIPLHEDFITDIDEAAHVLYVRLPFEL